MPTTRVGIESLWASLSGITLIIKSRIFVLPDNKIHDDEPAETEGHEQACPPDDADEDEDDDDSTLPDGEDTWGRDKILSKFTKDKQMEILELNWLWLKLQM